MFSELATRLSGNRFEVYSSSSAFLVICWARFYDGEGDVSRERAEISLLLDREKVSTKEISTVFVIFSTKKNGLRYNRKRIYFCRIE